MRAVLVERLTYGAVGTDVLGLTGPALLSLLSTRQSPNARTASSARNRALSQEVAAAGGASTRTHPLGDEV
jgi:hypothetical protein